MRTAGHAAPGDGMEMREVLWGVLWSQSPTLISHKRRYRDPRAGRILADGIAALFSRVISLPPPPPSPPLPLPTALPDPVPCSSPCPQHGAAHHEVTVIFTARAPGNTSQEVPIAGQKISPLCPQSLPRAEAMSLRQAGPLPAPVTCLSPARPQHPQPPTPLAGGSLHSGKTCQVLTCSQILSASGGPWIVFTLSRA